MHTEPKALYRMVQYEYAYRYTPNLGYIYIYILGVARYTDVMVRYVPRFGGHGSIRFRYNMKKKEIYYARFFLFILNRQ